MKTTGNAPRWLALRSAGHAALERVARFTACTNQRRLLKKLLPLRRRILLWRKMPLSQRLHTLAWKSFVLSFLCGLALIWTGRAAGWVIALAGLGILLSAVAAALQVHGLWELESIRARRTFILKGAGGLLCFGCGFCARREINDIVHVDPTGLPLAYAALGFTLVPLMGIGIVVAAAFAVSVALLAAGAINSYILRPLSIPEMALAIRNSSIFRFLTAQRRAERMFPSFGNIAMTAVGLLSLAFLLTFPLSYLGQWRGRFVPSLILGTLQPMFQSSSLGGGRSSAERSY